MSSSYNPSTSTGGYGATPGQEIGEQGGHQPVSGTQQTGQGVAQSIKEKTRQAGTQVSTQINKAMDATARGLQGTSTRISGVATYFEHSDTDKLISDLGNLIRRRPTQSLALGVLAGFFLGRMFRH